MIMWAGNERLTTAPFVRSLPSGQSSSIVTLVRSAALAAEPVGCLTCGPIRMLNHATGHVRMSTLPTRGMQDHGIMCRVVVTVGCARDNAGGGDNGKIEADK